MDKLQLKKSEKNRICIFIDGSNLYHSLKKLNIDRINFVKLTQSLVKNRKLISVYYYNSSLDIKSDPEKYWKQQRFFQELRKIPYFNVIIGKLKKIKVNNSIIYVVKGDDVNLVVDLISGLFEDKYDIAVIVSGDEDFIPAIKKIKELGKKVENAYFNSSSSNSLKKSADYSICINNIIKEII